MKSDDTMRKVILKPIRYATTFWEGIAGILKALVWPAVLIYKCLEFLKA